VKINPNDTVEGYGEEGHDSYQRGLTKREYFAGQALQGLLSDSRSVAAIENMSKTMESPSGKITADLAIALADMLIERLNAGGEK
jgi:hypothetical protein